MTTASYNPSAQSLQHRARIAQLISPLRRIRPRVPFWELAAHRIPTLWSLYRGLVRNAPGEGIAWRMRLFFEENRCLTSPKTTREKLLIAHKWLDAFESAKSGDVRMQRILQRYNNMIATKRTKERMKAKLIDALEWQHRLLTRPILTGSYLRPTLHNGPLPRMRRDPERVRMMIHKRKLAHERRGKQYQMLRGLIGDMTAEEKMWNELGVTDDEANGSYVRELENHQALIRASNILSLARQMTPYPPALLAQIKTARTERIRNKTHEKERARRGERFAYTEKLARKRPPAHVWERMSEERKRLDAVSRSMAEVGYVGKVKKMLGWKLKDGEAWKCEVGRDAEERERLDKAAKEIERVNMERRKATESFI